MRRILVPGLILLATGFGGCQSAPTIDPEVAAQELMDADRAFARETEARGADGWASYFLEDGIQYPPSGRWDGRETIRQNMSGVFSPENPLLVWEPTDASVSEAGDMGYTLGDWKSVIRSEGVSDSVLSTGHYVSFWKRDAEGEWKVAVDIGNRDAPPPTPGN